MAIKDQAAMDQLKASVVGGPVAAAEHVAGVQQRPDIVQQAINDAASKAQALDAPAAFQANQAKLISAPLNADVSSGAQSAAATSAYQSALGAAHGNYLSAVQGSYGPAATAMKLAAEGFGGYEQSARTAIHTLQRQQLQQANEEWTLRSHSQTQATDELNNRIKGAQSMAAQDPNVSSSAFGAINKVLGTSKDLATAIKTFDEEYHTDSDPKSPTFMAIKDKDGNILNYVKDANGNDTDQIDTSAPVKIHQYLTQAFAPQGPAATPGVLQPGTPEYDQFMRDYGNSESDGNYIASGGQ